MGARQKLNQLHLIGNTVIAAVLGILVQSWVAFFLAFAVLVGLGLHAGEIRPKKRKR